MGIPRLGFGHFSRNGWITNLVICKTQIIYLPGMSVSVDLAQHRDGACPRPSLSQLPSLATQEGLQGRLQDKGQTPMEGGNPVKVLH